MIKKNIGFFPNIKFAAVGFLLILIPCFVLSYIDYQSISKSTKGIRTNYEYTANFIRFKIEQEIINKEEMLSADFINNVKKNESASLLKSLLLSLENRYPFVSDAFILQPDGAFISTLISSQMAKSQINLQTVNKSILSNYEVAQQIEFENKDYKNAIVHYSKCLNNATAEDSVLLINRIACCYTYDYNIEKALDEYKKLLYFTTPGLTIASIPVHVVALSQIAEIYNSTNQFQLRNRTLLAVYAMLIEDPWDVCDGKYFFYLKSVSDEIENILKQTGFNSAQIKTITKLNERKQIIYKNYSFLNSTRESILRSIGIPLNNNMIYRTQVKHITFNDADSSFQIGFIYIQDPASRFKSNIFGFKVREKYMYDSIFPEILKNIDLGNNILAGVVDSKGNFLYPAGDKQNRTTLVSKNFENIFTSWKLVLYNTDGKSIEQIVDQRKQQAILLFAMTVLVMITGLIMMFFSVRYEYRISRLKSAFVSNISHELKTPLSIIRMFSETLESGIVNDSEKRSEFYSIISRESERLTNLINNVLDFSKIESGKKEFNFRETDITQITKDIIEMYRPKILAEGFNFDIIIPDKVIKMKIDGEAISQVILNLLNNAMKYSIEEKYIIFEIKEINNAVIISIKDNGIGIPKNEFENIFNHFYRLRNSRTNQIQGTGLGLTISKHIIEAHKGTIIVESTIGKGSIFTINLPV